MNQQHLDVSVVICAHTEARWDELARAVLSVQSQSVAPLEILVVIDHNPALLERAREELLSAVVIENREPRGISGSRNSGIAAARGAVVAFLDDDAIAAQDWIEQLLPGYADPGVLGVGGAIAPFWLRSRPDWFPEEFNWVVGCTYRGMPSAAASVRNLIGCNMSFRREVFRAIGGFRHGIGRVGRRPCGCEETELCIRLRQRWPGATLRYNPQARVLHQVPAGRATWSYFQARCYLEGGSKALVARLVGAADGSATERAYVLRALPRGIACGLADAAVRRDISGLLRAAAIGAGLAITTAGYLRGIVTLAVAGNNAVAPAPPIGLPLHDSEVPA